LTRTVAGGYPARVIDLDPNRPPATPRDAATLILLRPGARAPFEIFLVKRHARSSFMASAYVFPGGKLDDADAEPAVLARAVGRSPEQAARALAEPDAPTRAVALYVAAIRETFEEAGILLADVDSGADLAAARTQLAAGASFAEVLASLDARLRLDQLVPYTRWITPVVEPRRFDARFFLAVAPAGQTGSHDAHETTDAAWLSPAAALAEVAAGTIQLPPPTLRTLEILAEATSLAALLDETARTPPPYVDPLFRQEGEQIMLVLPGDPAHGTPQRALPGPTRFVLEGGRWWSRPHA
jgi:8-oxo-dGTP pyrophosphatase MutT (NUDIX family)